MLESACILYGDTPTCLFTSWRLSYTNISVIHISEKLSSDGMLSWKSNKLGSNFYMPNVFIKSVFNKKKSETQASFKEKIKGFLIDFLFLACNSVFELQQICQQLAHVITENTIVFVESNFGVNLDLIAYREFTAIRGEEFNVVVFGAISDLEGRKLTSGSFVLLSESIEYYFGVTYFQNFKDLSSIFLSYKTKINMQLNSKNSKLNLFINSLESSGEDMITLHKISIDSNELAIRIWNLVIFKLAFNIISIIYEDTDYNHFLSKNNSLARELSFNILKELTILAYYHCDFNFELLKLNAGRAADKVTEACFLPYIKNAKELDNIERLIDYEKCLKLVLQKKRFLNSELHNESSPEWVSLSFEAYSFYHKLEYPASILFKQATDLSVSFKKQSLCLKFLSQFYERLCLLSGMPHYMSASTIKISALSDITSKKQSIIFGKGGIHTGSTINKNQKTSKLKHNEPVENRHNDKASKTEPKKSLKNKKKKNYLNKNLKGEGNNLEATVQFLESHLRFTSTVNDLPAPIEDDIAALYFDALDNINDVRCDATKTIAATAFVEEEGCSTFSTSSYKSDESSFSDSDSTTSLELKLSRQSIQNKTYSKVQKILFDFTNSRKTNAVSPFIIPKKCASDASSANSKSSETKYNRDSRKAVAFNNFHKPQYSHDSSLIALKNLMHASTENDVIYRLSHKFEIEDKSRYHGLYGDNFASDLFSTKNADDEILKAKRKELMKEISRFRRFKIDNSLKFGYGNNFQINQNTRSRFDCTQPFQKYINVLSAPINLDLSDNSTNRFGQNDSIGRIMDRNEKRDEEDHQQNGIKYKKKTSP